MTKQEKKDLYIILFIVGFVFFIIFLLFQKGEDKGEEIEVEKETYYILAINEIISIAYSTTYEIICSDEKGKRHKKYFSDKHEIGQKIKNKKLEINSKIML